MYDWSQVLKSDPKLEDDLWRWVSEQRVEDLLEEILGPYEALHAVDPDPYEEAREKEWMQHRDYEAEEKGWQ